MLNSELTTKQAIEQLNQARQEIADLQIKIQEMQKMFRAYEKQDRTITFNVPFLYYQIKFLMDAQERFGQIVTRDNKIVQVKSYYE